VDWLLGVLVEVGAEEEEASALAARAATHLPLDNSFAVNLIDSLWGVGTEDQAAALIEHLPATGRFREFLQVSDHRSRFRFGREPDGSAAPSWAWDDLE
jgi:alkanesulfonate monooxygenase SsuD/methylene tetrahydromethanopterin reductase-like flavin-dependent oxidoreductase (luciferase family)